MRDADKNEEIIELTEVVEEKPGPEEKELFRPFSPPLAEEKSAGLRFPSGQDFEPAKKVPSPTQSYESEVEDLEEDLREKAEEWMASEGARILERVAREMFPKIAEEVLRREIEKLKAEIKEKE